MNLHYSRRLRLFSALIPKQQAQGGDLLRFLPSVAFPTPISTDQSAKVAETTFSIAAASAAAVRDPQPPPTTTNIYHKKTQRHHHNHKADRVASLLKSSSSSLSHLKQIHAHVFRSHLHHNNSLASLLLSFYSSFSSSIALLVFSSVPRPNLSLFNHAIRALSKFSSHCPHALQLYLRMTHQRISPDNFTFPFLLNSSAALSDLRQGVELHSRLLRTGFGSYNPVGNALIDMYGKCDNALDRSQQAFDEMPVRDVVSYNALLGAYARRGEDMESARRLFDGMPMRNVISWNGMIVGYVNGGDLSSARALFDQMPVRNVVSWTVMVVGFTKSGLVDAARVLFEGMPERNLVSWTAMITGYAQCGRPVEAMSLFREMERAGIEPDAVTMTGVISASAQLGGAELANWVGSYVDRKGIERNERVLTALVDMHAKCGNVEEALHLFEEIPFRDAFSYSALINGLASHGHGMEALNVFRRMRAEAIKPDPITFIGVLNACSHTGLVDEGLRYWESMIQEYRIEPESDHYACIVDMLGRAGRLEEAHEMVRRMPMGPHAGALGALLAACRTYGNVEIAESIAGELFELEPENTGNYVLLSSIYALREQWRDVARVRKMMKERGVKKLPGYSWIEDVDRGHRLSMKS